MIVKKNYADKALMKKTLKMQEESSSRRKVDEDVREGALFLLIFFIVMIPYHSGQGDHEFQNQFLSGYSGTEAEFNDVKHLILKEDDIVGLLETEDIEDLKPLNDRVFIKDAEAEKK